MLGHDIAVIKFAIILTYFFGFLGGLFALLFGATFSDASRETLPILKSLGEKQVHLGVATIVCWLIALATGIWKEFLSLKLKPSVEVIQGPGGGLTQRATLTGFEKELEEAASERAREVKDYFNAAERDFAARRYRDAANNYQKSVNALPTMSALLNLGTSLSYVSDYPKAENVFTAGLQIARKKGRKEFEGAFLGNIGNVYFDQGKLDEALRSFQAALDLFKQIGNPLGQANALGNIGNVYANQGKLDEALRSFQAALDLFKQIGNPLGQANALGNIGNVYANQGKKPEALEMLRQASSIYLKIGAGGRNLQIIEDTINRINATMDKPG